MLKAINESFNRFYKSNKSIREEYAYVTRHGLGPGMIPRNVKIIRWEEPNDYDTVIYVDRQLTPQEMNEYEFKEYSEITEEIDNVREYSDMLFDMIEEGIVDAESIAKDLIYWCSEDDIKRYMEVNDIINPYDEDEDF